MNKMRLFTGMGLLVVTLCPLAHALSFSVGGRAGLNLSSLRSDLLENEIAETNGDKALQPGLNIAGFFTFHFNDYIAVSAELGYSPRGVTYTLPEADVFVEVREKYNYVEIPLLAEINIPLDSPVQPFFHLGISPAFLASAEVAEEEGIETSIENVEHLTKDSDLSFVSGAGVRFRLGPGSIIALVRYSHGLVNIIELGESRETSVFAISAGYGFEFGR